MSASRDLTQGPVWRGLAAVSAPMSLGILGVLSVGLADAYFLGQLGEEPLAAVGYIYPVTAAITSLSIGLSAGANAAISQAIGRKDGEDAEQRLALHAIAIGVTLATLLAAVFYVASSPLFRLIGAGDAVMEEIEKYIPFWTLSFPVLVLMMLSQATFRAHGDGATAAIVMVASAVINIALTPVFIYGTSVAPELGTGGAALATLIARILGAAAALYWALHTGKLKWCSNILKGFMGSVKTIIKVGGPAALSNAINPAGMAAVTAAVATLGETAVAAFGAATRVQSLAMVPMMALSAGIGPVVGQNWGADKHERAARGLHWALWFCLVYGLAIAALLSIFATPIATLLTDGGNAAEQTALYLRIVGWSFFGYGFVVVTNAAMNARDKAVWSMSLSLGRIFAVYLPGAWLGVTVFDYTGVLIAAVAANILAALAALWMGRRTGLITPHPLPQTTKDAKAA
ncbi:MATE family efflux transporter [Pseudooctadecabacter jejudonensis]|uniref:Multidrug export protein MepA n=1 Tax=Pseudooctadecabacter jejudonensis TaxID=1391910 RepID=A0A1Y5RLN6_9RHOB|nr:MATE family efflux transporter [Pseudooctadecabacter jejudonensis]SLN19402.1 Multidrug export protein MepA [Pseudooctadecabacter jejudonensis]